MTEELKGRHGSIGDRQQVVKRLHSLGIIHGDLNRHNFIVTTAGVRLIDFENGRRNGSQEAMDKEYNEIAEQLMERTGPFVPEP